MFFGVGGLVIGHAGWLARARRAMPWLAVGCAVLYAIFLWRLAAELPGQAHPTVSWPVAALEAILSVWLTVLCLRSGEHTSELQSLMRNSYAVFCLKKKTTLKAQQHKQSAISY